MKQSRRSQQCDTSGQTLRQLLAAVRKMRKSKARSSYGLARHREPCKDKLLGSGCPTAPTTWNPSSVLLWFQCPCSCSVVSSFFQGWATTDLPLRGSLSCKWWIWICLLKKLWDVLDRVMRPSASLGLGEPFKASTPPHPCLQTSAWGQPWEANVPGFPWSRWVCLKEGVTALVFWVGIFGSLITGTCSGTTEVEKSFIELAWAIPSSFPSSSKATGCARFSTVWQKD